MPFETLIDCDQLARHLDDPAWHVVDCRFDLADTSQGERDYAKAHLPGAIYAHLERDLSGPPSDSTGRHPLPDPTALCHWLERHGITPDSQIIAYDASGGAIAARLWWLLRWLGHRPVAVLDGGWPAWVRAELPTDNERPSARPAGRLPCHPDSHQVVDIDSIHRQIDTDSQTLLLMDARSAERFRGDAEPIDPVAGHIPGALNLPLQLNLTSDGRFKPAAQLRALYSAALGQRSPGGLVAMCGSGITACHNLLAMEIAGLHGGRLYAGSWSQWIRDPARPVATGEQASTRFNPPD